MRWDRRRPLNALLGLLQLLRAPCNALGQHRVGVGTRKEQALADQMCACVQQVEQRRSSCSRKRGS